MDLKVKDYTTHDDIYTYKRSNVLKNKFNIGDGDILEKEEGFFSSIRLVELQNNPIIKNLDFQNLKDIHYYIFQDIYDFAGEIRKVDIEKGASKFCRSEFIQEEGNRIFRNLIRNNYFQDLSEEDFFKKFADFIGDIIALHPFREGNGRAGRELFRLLALKNGYELNYSLFSKKEILEADIDAFNCKPIKLIELMKKGLLNKK